MGTEYLNNKMFEVIIIKFQNAQRLKNRSSLLYEEITEQFTRISKLRKKKLTSQHEDLLKNYQKASVDLSESQKELANAFYVLSKNIVNSFKFNLIDIDDATQEGVLICFEKIKRFDPSKGKAFNYMTTCILNHFRQLYRSARNYNELKRKYFDFMTNSVEELKPLKKTRGSTKNKKNN